MDVLESKLSRCRFLAIFSSFLFVLKTSLIKYSSFVDRALTSLSLLHQPWSFHTKNRPPLRCISLMISWTTFSRLDLTVPRFGPEFRFSSYLFSIKRCTLEFPRYDTEETPWRNNTSSNCGHSTTSESYSGASAYTRPFNHCLMFPSLMFPENVRGMCSVGMP